jgi:hypothetical protein
MDVSPDSDPAIQMDSPELQGQWGQGASGVTLCALPSYWRATPEERHSVCNGAGPGWLIEHLPWYLRWTRRLADGLWGLDCNEVFDIHDWDFLFMPPTMEGFVESNNRLSDNLGRYVCAMTSNSLLRWARMRNGRRYMVLVREFGHRAYFDRTETAT